MADSTEPLHPAPTPEPDASILFGRYRVERELGRGGMGRVLLAFDEKLRIHVAVKLVPDQFMSDAEALEDLRREVLRGMALTHPSVVRTHTLEQDATGAAIVMEYVDGLTFTEWKEQQPGRCFDCAELLPWLGPLCEVLDYAHRDARIVHRDLKPRNIMVSRDGRLKVADFGIAATLTDSLSRGTGQGNLSGTPAYMGPQQARGKKPSHLDDVYSLGATIYDLIAGKPPFFRGAVDTILLQVVAESAPTMTERREELMIEGKAPIPRHWEQTIAACLAKEPAARPQSCGEVLARLQELIPAAPQPHKPVKVVPPEPGKKPVVRVGAPRQAGPTPPPKRGWLVPVIGLAICGVGFGAWWLPTGKKPAAPAPTPLAVATPAPVAAPPPPLATPAPTPAPATPEPATPAPVAAIPTPPPATPKPQSEIDKWLTQVDAIYQPKWQSEVVAPYEKGMDDLKKSVLSALDVQLATTSRAAKLQDALALRNERVRIESGRGVPADDSDTPPATLKTLRDTWRAQIARLEAERRQHAQGVFGQYDQVLATNQAALTQRQRLDEALQLQQRRDALKKEWMPAIPAIASRSVANLTAATKDKPFVNTLGMKFVPVPGTDILICIHETRRKDYAAYSDAVPGADETWKAPMVEGKRLSQADDHPVVQVSWEDATAFCDWLSKMEGRTYRLPTEHEWNLAVVIGLANPKAISDAELSRKLGGQYPWGTSNEMDATQYGNYKGSADGYDGTAPVISFLPNHLGIYDLGGNAWEWCNDFDATKKKAVLRGCDFLNHGPYRASNTREVTAPDSRAPVSDSYHLLMVPGFRCVLAVSNTPAPPARSAASIGGRADATLAHSTKESPFVNDLGMKFVPVPGTKVLLCLHETRCQDYAVYAGEVSGVNNSWRDPTVRGIVPEPREAHPVVNVNCNDARGFCAWLSKKEGRTYRLPTDREWSLAVGIGREEKWNPGTKPGDLNEKLAGEFPWGKEWPPARKAGNYADTARHEIVPVDPFINGYTDGFPLTAPVMSFKPNALGIYDLGGNAEEWVEDQFDAQGPEGTVRGAAFNTSMKMHLLSSHRARGREERRLTERGFRCVVELPGP